MTLISEQIFKPYSSCLPSYAANDRAGSCNLHRTGYGVPPYMPPDGCTCLDRDAVCLHSEGPERVRNRLGRLLDKDIARLEQGKNPAKLLKRGKLIARWAKAAKAMAATPCPATGSDRVESADCGPDDPNLCERPVPVPLGVEAFRSALAKELLLIRNKKENIP